MPTTVAVIGGGPLGLMTLKNLREDGFDATLFESRNWVGGLWKHSTDASVSTTPTTRFNNSKYLVGISDFPMTEDMDDFPTAPQLLKYLESYCDHFGLWPHIRLKTAVKAVRRTDDDWSLDVAKAGELATGTLRFDKVLFACGSFVEPRMPEIKGIEKFAGECMHSIKFHGPKKYEGKNVVIMGLNASAEDAVTGLAGHTNKMYISHRSGAILLPRYLEDGAVYDSRPGLGIMIILLYIATYIPAVYVWLIDSYVRRASKKAYPDVPHEWGFSPGPSTAVRAPLIASDLYPLLKSGVCEPVPNIAVVLGPKTIKLTSGRILEDIDAIICCTGYHSYIPVRIEPEELNPYEYPGAAPNLYRNLFSLSHDPAIRNSVAFYGQAAAPPNGFSNYEMQIAAISQIWLGNSSLPSREDMVKWHEEYIEWRALITTFFGGSSTFYTVFVPMVDYLVWLDETAGLGIKARFGLVERWTNNEAWSLWWNDRKLYNICLSGLASPAIYRLFDVGKRKAWPGARQQIFLDNERAARQRKDRLELWKKEKAAGISGSEQ